MITRILGLLAGERPQREGRFNTALSTVSRMISRPSPARILRRKPMKLLIPSTDPDIIGVCFFEVKVKHD